MKKLALLALALGSMAVACSSPTTINIQPSGSSNDGGSGSSNDGGSGGAPSGGNTGEGGDPQVDEPSAHDVYVNELHPSVASTCVGCHNKDNQIGAPAVLDIDPEYSYTLTRAYTNVITDPAEISLFVTKGPHSGPGLTTAQHDLAIKWINMELSEGGGGNVGDTTSSSSSGGGTGTTMTLEDLLASFAACMEYDLWDSSGMDQFPLQQTNGEGACLSCHNTGTGAFWASGDPVETFDKAKNFPYIMRLVTPIYEGANAVDLAPSNRLVNKGKEPCANPPICHPKYDLTPENKAALETFVGQTLQKWQAGACPKP